MDETNLEKGLMPSSSWSNVEQCFLHEEQDTSVFITAGERMKAIEVATIQDLALLIVLRFLEWCHDNNPNGGVAVLPTTGPMSSIFYKQLSNFKNDFDIEKQKAIQRYPALLNKSLLQSFPDTSNTSLVGMHEFFPILPTHEKSCSKDLRETYGTLLNIQSENIHCFDLLNSNIISEDEMIELEIQQDVLHSLLLGSSSSGTIIDEDDSNDDIGRLKEILQKIQKYCDDFERKISQELGGIGFFIDGIGLDGSIGMNQPTTTTSSDTAVPTPITATTRLVALDYCTAASLATDLGGIENARTKMAMTIGLETITRHNPNATIIVLASGEGQAQIVSNALEYDETACKEPKPVVSAFYNQLGSRMYMTSGAASLLRSRLALKLSHVSESSCVDWATKHLQLPTPGTISPHLIEPPSDYLLLESYIYQTSLSIKVAVKELTPSHFHIKGVQQPPPQITTYAPQWLVTNPSALQTLKECALRRLLQKIEGGLEAMSNTRLHTLLHTAPHHDDIMLSYHAVMHEMLGRKVLEEPSPVATTTAGTNGAAAEQQTPVAVKDDQVDTNIESTTITATQDDDATKAQIPEKGEEAEPSSVAGSKRKRHAASSGDAKNASAATAAPTTTTTTNQADLITEPQEQEEEEAEKLGEQINGNINHFAYLTSGFNSVPDDFLAKWINGVRGSKSYYSFLEKSVSRGDLQRDYDDLLGEFRRAFFAELDNSKSSKARRKKEQTMTRDEIENIIFLRKVAEVFDIDVSSSPQDGEEEEGKSLVVGKIAGKLEKIRVSYLGEEPPAPDIVLPFLYSVEDDEKQELTQCARRIKGCMRETEVDRVWALSRMSTNRVHHLRSKFYMEKKPPTTEDDAMPVARLIRKLQPTMISVAFDPEGTGPDTHYKVLKIVADAVSVCMEPGDDYLRQDVKDKLLVWGYRNVWFTFTPSDATLFLPASEADLDLLDKTFVSCFSTQKEASYPSPYFDGPFSGWSCHLQRMQKDNLDVLLGEAFFREHPNHRVRNATGFVFIKAMPARRFLREVKGLESTVEGGAPK